MFSLSMDMLFIRAVTGAEEEGLGWRGECGGGGGAYIPGCDCLIFFAIHIRLDKMSK